MLRPLGRPPSRISSHSSSRLGPLGSQLALVHLVSKLILPFGSLSNSRRAFGATGGFGQTQQQQPQANPMFGNLGGTPNTNTGTGGFGTP
jgi:hypothetical protein